MSDERDRLERWPSVFRHIEPLPGGVFALRRRLRERARARVALPAVAAAACALAVLAWLVVWPRGAVVPDRSAAARLFAGDPVPHPEAVALGLADRRAAEQAAEPRVRAGVVFFWVAPADTPRGDRPFVDVADPRDPALRLR